MPPPLGAALGALHPFTVQRSRKMDEPILVNAFFAFATVRFLNHTVIKGSCVKNALYKLWQDTVTLVAAIILTKFFISGRLDANVIRPPSMGLISIIYGSAIDVRGDASTAIIASRKVPGPLSAAAVTGKIFALAVKPMANKITQQICFCSRCKFFMLTNFE